MAVLTVERLIDLSLFKRLIIKTKITLIKITIGIKGRFNPMEKMPPKITPCISINRIGIKELRTITTPAKGKEMPEISIPIKPYKIGLSAKSFTNSSMLFPYSSDFSIDFSFPKNLTVFQFSSLMISSS